MDGPLPSRDVLCLVQAPALHASQSSPHLLHTLVSGGLLGGGRAGVRAAHRCRPFQFQGEGGRRDEHLLHAAASSEARAFVARSSELHYGGIVQGW